MSIPFTVLIRVRYAECDAQQVVFNSRYAEYADLAATEYMRALVGGYQELIAQGYDNQVVNMTLTWKNPARFDDVIAMQIDVSKVGNSSYTLSISMLDHFSGQPICNIEIVYVMVDAKTFLKQPIPDSLRQKLQVGPGHQVINLAGVDN